MVFKFVPFDHDEATEADNLELLGHRDGQPRPQMMGFWAGMLLPDESFQDGQIPWAHFAASGSQRERVLY